MGSCNGRTASLMTTYRIAALALALGSALSRPCGAQQRQEALADSMRAPVLSSRWPARLSAYVGRWTLTLHRSDSVADLVVAVALGPDSVSRLAERLQLNHTCYDCLGGPLLGPAWDTPGWRAPATSRLQLFLRSEPGPVTGFLGTGWVVSTPLGLVLEGFLERGGASGTWHQLGDSTNHLAPIAQGTFTLVRDTTE